MNKKLEVGQKWAHIDIDGKEWAIYEIINIDEDGNIEDAIIKQTEKYDGAVGLVHNDGHIEKYFSEYDMQPVYKVSPLWRCLND
jgi:hypothetical protein